MHLCYRYGSCMWNKTTFSSNRTPLKVNVPCVFYNVVCVVRDGSVGDAALGTTHENAVGGETLRVRGLASPFANCISRTLSPYKIGCLTSRWGSVTHICAAATRLCRWQRGLALLQDGYGRQESEFGLKTRWKQVHCVFIVFSLSAGGNSTSM